MADLAQSFADRVKAIGGSWTAYTAVGSFVLYVLGYLALRFHLTAIGVSTDLAVLDERYLFTGARFLVYLVSAVPILVLVALPAIAVGWALSRALPAPARVGVSTWLMQPARLTVLGIV